MKTLIMKPASEVLEPFERGLGGDVSAILFLWKQLPRPLRCILCEKPLEPTGGTPTMYRSPDPAESGFLLLAAMCRSCVYSEGRAEREDAVVQAMYPGFHGWPAGK
jgi:hypothetical protein